MSKDYGFHCELGGHPVPGSDLLLGGGNELGVQNSLVDLMLHCWRIWDQVRRWSVGIPEATPIIASKPEIAERFAKWGEQDPTYALAVAFHPETSA